MRILVTDDVPSARKVLKKLLTRLGFADLHEASNGREALNEFTRQPFDLVIADWQMPEMDGLEMIRQLRNLPGGEQVPVLMVTSSNEKEKVIEALKAGVEGYLCKPFSIENLRDRLKELCPESNVPPG